MKLQNSNVCVHFKRTARNVYDTPNNYKLVFSIINIYVCVLSLIVFVRYIFDLIYAMNIWSIFVA